MFSCKAISIVLYMKCNLAFWINQSGRSLEHPSSDCSVNCDVTEGLSSYFCTVFGYSMLVISLYTKKPTGVCNQKVLLSLWKRFNNNLEPFLRCKHFFQVTSHITAVLGTPPPTALDISTCPDQCPSDHQNPFLVSISVTIYVNTVKAWGQLFWVVCGVIDTPELNKTLL